MSSEREHACSKFFPNKIEHVVRKMEANKHNWTLRSQFALSPALGAACVRCAVSFNNLNNIVICKGLMCDL
jgi:hypothetical protein